MTGNSEGSYALSFAGVTASITPKPATVSFTAADKEYDGSRTAAVRDFVFTGVVDGDALAVAAATAQFTESRVGTWPVTIDPGCTVTGNGDGNYAIAFAPVQAEITPKPVTASFTAADKVYDGNAMAQASSFDFGGQLVAGDVLTITGPGGAATVPAAFSQVKAGVWKVTVVLASCTVTGNDEGNYAISFSDQVTATITPKPVAVSFTAEDKTYDGSRTATVRDFVFTGVVEGDVLSVQDATAQFAESRVGAWPVTLDPGYTVTGNSEGSYALSFAGVTASITPKPVTVSFTAADKEYDGTTVAVATLLDFTPQLAPVDQATVTVTVLQAAFDESTPGDWPVTILDSAITGNDDGNYGFTFADDVKAEIRHNTQIVPSGWSMMVLCLDRLTAESAGVWRNLGVLAFRNATIQIQRGIPPAYGESFWVFNRGNDAVNLQGLKRFDAQAWAPPAIKNAWVMTGPPAEDFVVPAGAQVWAWNGRVFVLIPAGDKLPAGSAAWFWP